MTNELITVTNVVSREISGLDVVNSVNGFYSTAFDHILWLLGTLILLLGIVVPLVFYFFQKRQLALKEKALSEELESQFAQLSQALKKENADFFSNEKIALKKEIERLEMEAQKQMSFVAAGICSVQANIYLEKGSHRAAFLIFAQALKGTIQAEKLELFQTMIRFVTTNVLAKMKKSDLDENNLKEFNEALELAQKKPAQGLLNTDIEAAKKALSAAKNREA